jgi:hypothetical protein
LPGEGYFCTVWRIDERVRRELFIEVLPPTECPNRLRVGLYFYDSAAATQLPFNRRLVVQRLRENRFKLRQLGLALTSSNREWDEQEFGALVTWNFFPLLGILQRRSA